MVIRNGKKYEYTLRQIVKAYEGRTYKRASTIREHYKRIYERTRNKLRNYERYTGAKKQSVSKYLRSHARWKNTLRSEGLKYRPRATTEYIEKFSASRNANIHNFENIENTQNYINDQYGGLIEKDKYAQAIMERYANDPQKQLQALTDYATMRNQRYSNLKKTATGRYTIREKGGIYSDEVSKEAYESIIETYDE